MANLFSKRIKGEEERTQLQAVVFSDADKSIGALKKNQIDNYDKLESYKKLRKRRIKKAWARVCVWLGVILLLPVFVFFSIVIINPKAGHNLFGYTFYIISTESMKGEIEPGDCIVTIGVNSTDDIKIGSDITFIRKSDGETVTHKVVEICTDKDGDIEYITKGVHNINVDSGAVSFDDVLGVRIKTIAWLGQLVTYFRTPYGIVTFLLMFVSVISLIYYSFKISNDVRAVGFR